MFSPSVVESLILRWKDDPASTYATWFLWEERLKNFRSIRRGIAQVALEIRESRFGNAYRGSSLETVVGSIAEQRQIFKGADHAFLWKPKLRIPDIYENASNQAAFGRLLQACDCCDTEEGVLTAIREIDALGVKGLGPAVANLLYFIHPTLVPPFNTAIVRGYNALTGSRVKLGRWDHYLAMRKGILALNLQHRGKLSNDLGAIAGMLFDLGSGRYVLPAPLCPGSSTAWQADVEIVKQESAAAQKSRLRDAEMDRSHAEVQAWLRDMGRALGFDVWVASNDRGRPYAQGKLGDGCLERLPDPVANQEGGEAVKLIDVLWLDRESGAVAAGFEVEHTTSIYSGIVRLLDLALGSPSGGGHALFLVAPDIRRDDVRQQLARPAFSRVRELGIRFIAYGDLERERAAIARFGNGLKPVQAISAALET